MDSNKHAEVLSMTVETDEGPCRFDYIYCEGYEITCTREGESGAIIVLSPLSEYRLPKDCHEAFKWHRWDLPSLDKENCYPVIGATEFIKAVCERHNTNSVIDVYSIGWDDEEICVDSSAVMRGHYDYFCGLD